MGFIDKFSVLSSTPNVASKNHDQSASGDFAEREDDSFFDCEEAHLHPNAHKLGGLACHDSKLREEQQEAIKEWITTIGKNLLVGNGLASTPAPVKIFEPRSNLQKLTDMWVYTSFLDRAAMTQDRLQRLVLVTAWFVSGLRHNFDTWRKPFNPLLGETWQARNAAGCEVFMEQISHHPPIAAFKLRGAHEHFEFQGTAEGGIQVSMKYRGFSQTFKGQRLLTFEDGDQIEISEMPIFTTKGVTSSADLRADVMSRAVLTYRTAGLAANLNFGPADAPISPLYARTDCVMGNITSMSDTGSPMSSSSSEAGVVGLQGSEPGSLDGERQSDASRQGLAQPQGANRLRTTLTDTNRSTGGWGLLKHTSQNSQASSRDTSPKAVHGAGFGMLGRLAGKLRGSGPSVPGLESQGVLGVFRGSWLSHLDFEPAGGPCERVWTLDESEALPFRNVPQEERLPSDCSFREDMRYLALGDVKAAQAAKDRLEAKQRAERKHRPANLSFQ